MKEPNSRLQEKVSAGITSVLLGLYTAIIFTANYRSEHLKQMFGEGLAKIAEAECDTRAQRKEFLTQIYEAALDEIRLMNDRE